MKKIILSSCLLLSTFIYSQKKEIIKSFNLNSVAISVDSIQEIDTINWEVIKESFKENDPESDVFLKVAIKQIKNENVKMSFSFKVEGKAANIDSLVLRLKKGVTKIKKVVAKLNNKIKKNKQ